MARTIKIFGYRFRMKGQKEYEAIDEKDRPIGRIGVVRKGGKIVSASYNGETCESLKDVAMTMLNDKLKG